MNLKGRETNHRGVYARCGVEGRVLHRSGKSAPILDKAEAKSHFDTAVDVASKLGDEIVPRWAAILDLANAAAGSQGAGPRSLAVLLDARNWFTNMKATTLIGKTPFELSTVFHRPADSQFSAVGTIEGSDGPMRLSRLVSRTCLTEATCPHGPQCRCLHFELHGIMWRCWTVV